jgi:hypothetical protein
LHQQQEFCTAGVSHGGRIVVEYSQRPITVSRCERPIGCCSALRTGFCGAQVFVLVWYDSVRQIAGNGYELKLLKNRFQLRLLFVRQTRRICANANRTNEELTMIFAWLNGHLAFLKAAVGRKTSMELNVKHKASIMENTIERQQPVLKMIFLNIVFLILFVSLLSCNNKKEEAEEVEEADRPAVLIDVKENNSTVSDYVKFVESDDNKMDLDHSYTTEALDKLVQATNAMADEIDYDVKADLDKVKQYADGLQEDPFATTHADNIRKGAEVVTNALVKMQQAKFPELSEEAQEVKRACASIEPEKLTLDQKDAVKSFFRKAADLLEKMN